MAFKTYAEGLKNANDLAHKAVLTQSSLNSLPPLASPIPTLLKAFPLYISAAEAYSHLLYSSIVPEAERPGIKKKWRLVLERAGKVKARVEELGGQVGKALVGDDGDEEAITGRGGVMNGIQMEMWSEPSEREFVAGKEGMFRDSRQPELADEQKALDAEWAEVPQSASDVEEDKEKWMVKQGPGADCSVVAGLGVCIEHNRKWGSTLAQNSLYPQAVTGRPRHSENGKHIVKLLLNGAWRSVLIDALLPRSATSHGPLHPTSYLASDLSNSASSSSIGPPWFPLATKAYFKAFGGYSIQGSNPAPDIYAFTGWTPERLGLRDITQREKTWRRIKRGWDNGHVLVTLGTGEAPGQGLLPSHAYGVLDIRETDEDRLLEIFDPGEARTSDNNSSSLQSEMSKMSLVTSTSRSRIFTMTWDDIFTDFGAMYLNWDPTLMPVTVTRHWSWPKPIQPTSDSNIDVLASNPRFRLRIDSAPTDSEVWILVSQHIANKVRPLDDIALHVFEEHKNTSGRSKPRVALGPQKVEALKPYTNSSHILLRYTPRRPNIDLLVIPARDRGVYRTNFTLQAFAPSLTHLSLERISLSLPFTQSTSGSLTKRNSGGHPGWPSWMNNPQYRMMIAPQPRGNQAAMIHVVLSGEKEIPWHVMLLWGQGEIVFKRAPLLPHHQTLISVSLTQDMIIGDSGSHSYGMAYLDIPSLDPGTYTLAISSFEPGQSGAYSLCLESSHPTEIGAIPAEGAGFFGRVVKGSWTEETAGGRPAAGQYPRNPKIEVILPKAATVMCRLLLGNSSPTPIPLNLTIFRRGPSATLGEQLGTSGPYSDALSGVTTGKVKLDAGVHLLVVSAWDVSIGIGQGWEVKIWSDSVISAELCS